MVTVVVVCNLLIALGCCYLAVQIWQIRNALAATAQIVAEWDQATHEGLVGAPDAILQGKLAAKEVRDRYRKLQPRLRQIQQLLSVLNWLRSLLQRRGQLPQIANFRSKRPPLR